MSTFVSLPRVSLPRILVVPALLATLALGLPAANAQTSQPAPTVTPSQSAAPAAKAKTRSTRRPGIDQRIATLHT